MKRIVSCILLGILVCGMSGGVAAAQDVNIAGTFVEPTTDPASSGMRHPWGGHRMNPEGFMKKFDTDGDGKLSDAEKQAADAARKQRPAPEKKGFFSKVGTWFKNAFAKIGIGKKTENEPGQRFGKPGKGLGHRGMPPQMTEEQKKAMLTKFDADGDGKLSQTEMKASFEARRAEMIKKYDTDGDGKLNDTEKAAMMKDRPAMKPGKGPGQGGMPPQMTEEQKKAMLTKFDADGDGKLSQAEMKASFEARRAEMTKKYDTDGDGKLNDTEKAAMMKDRPAMKPGKGRHGTGRGIASRTVDPYSATTDTTTLDSNSLTTDLTTVDTTSTGTSTGVATDVTLEQAYNEYQAAMQAYTTAIATSDQTKIQQAYELYQTKYQVYQTLKASSGN